MLNALSIDVEDYFHTEAMTAAVGREKWPELPSRVEASTDRLFELLAQKNVRATMFFLGWVAERFPGLVQKAVAAGHEIACHSYWHRPVFRLSPREFREDTLLAKKVIEDAAGQAVRGYRAPSFSMTPGTEWAFEILGELGFTYDSSVNPIRHDFYSNADKPRFPYEVQGGLKELPIATIHSIGTRWPCGGGAYLRILPLAYSRTCLRRLNRDERRAAMFYLHPWELDPAQPRLPAPWKSRLRQYTGLGRMQGNLERLLGEFAFAPIHEAFRQDLPAAQSLAAQRA